MKDTGRNRKIVFLFFLHTCAFSMRSAKVRRKFFVGLALSVGYRFHNEMLRFKMIDDEMSFYVHVYKSIFVFDGSFKNS